MKDLTFRTQKFRYEHCTRNAEFRSTIDENVGRDAMANDMTDRREVLYRPLHKAHSSDEAARMRSAEQVLVTLFQRYKPLSLLDVGCGVGIWLAAAQRLGITDLCGVEGSWVLSSDLFVDKSIITTHELECALELDRRYDLTISIEVAEHLSVEAADVFIESLTRHSDLVLFSAAIPGQGGTGHQNEQFPDYWAEKFAKQNYKPLDFVRKAIWGDKSVQVWLRQNVIPFASPHFVKKNQWAIDLAKTEGPLSLVHPDLYIRLYSLLSREARPY